MTERLDALMTRSYQQGGETRTQYTKAVVAPYCAWIVWQWGGEGWPDIYVKVFVSLLAALATVEGLAFIGGGRVRIVFPKDH